VIGEHPLVIEAGAIAVPSELGEDDDLVAVVAREPIEAEAIAAWCRDRLAPIKVPRYVVFVDSLPKTATHRVEKYRLRGDATLRARAVDLTRSW
jgi:crotonobetaine/carnitine-CoA ligase